GGEVTELTMKIQAMLDWSPEEKAAKAKEWAQSLFTLRLQKATGQLENPMKIKELRKDIARLKTAQHMSAAEAGATAAEAQASQPQAATSEEAVSSKVKEAAAAPKSKGHVTPPGKGAKKRAAAHKKTTAAAPSKGHSPSKKSAGQKGKTAGVSKVKSAAHKKSKKK
ncbi:MAG: 50S ribosomal protein L29, partial [Thermoanaerobaculia bacterium]